MREILDVEYVKETTITYPSHFVEVRFSGVATSLRSYFKTVIELIYCLW